MWTLRRTVAGVTAVVLISTLVSGCELREGDSREYGRAAGVELDVR